jgi:fructose-1,6-bisphosphatase I
MPHRRTTFSKFIIEDQRSRANPDPELTGLLNDIQTACKFIASAVSRGALYYPPRSSMNVNPSGETPQKLDAIASDIMLRECEWGGQLCGMIFEKAEQPYLIPSTYPRGRYLLAFDALEGSANLDINVTVGTIFSVLRAPDGVQEPAAADFLQTGSRQVAAGFALYGPTSIIVLTLGSGVHGFTLDREIGAYTLTHPNMRIPEETNEFAIDASNERSWEAPIRYYVDECVQGNTGARGVDFSMRWVDSLVSEVHRILLRGGLLIYPRDLRDAAKHGGGVHLLYEANAVAMIVEQAGGAASTGRERILDVVPTSLQQGVPLILGSIREVERLVRYHETSDRGEELVFATPLFNSRSLFRSSV